MSDTPHSTSGTPADPEWAEAIAEIGDEPITENLPRNKWPGVIARLVLSFALLGILWWRLPGVKMSDVLPRADVRTFSWFIAAVVIHVIAYGLQTLRWRQVSVALGLTTPFRKMFGYLLAGEFVSNALPTSFGGDVVRVMRQGAEVGDYADSFAATALERLTGWLVLPIISVAALAMRPSLLHLGHASTAAIIVNIATLVALLAVLSMAGHPRGAGRLVDDPGWKRFLGAVHLGIVAFRGRYAQIGAVITAGIGFQLLQCLSVWAAAQALDLPAVDLIVVMAFFPPAAIIQNIPLTIGGIGIREAAFVLFFGAVGVSNPSAIGLGLSVYLVFVLASLAGAPSFILHRTAATAPATSRNGPDRNGSSHGANSLAGNSRDS